MKLKTQTYHSIVHGRSIRWLEARFLCKKSKQKKILNPQTNSNINKKIKYTNTTYSQTEKLMSA